jgi:dipeptidyl aminopeptidase/acylaminoacyl peptidase
LTCAAKNTPKPNYELAARFSEKKIGEAVFSTSIRPNWFKNSDRFWYKWQTPQGAGYYIVDPLARTKTTVFDMDRLAMELTEIIKDPFDAQHIPIRNLELIDDDAKFRFEIVSTLPAPKDTSKKKENVEGEDHGRTDDSEADDGTSLGGKKLFRFTYDIASHKLTDITGPKKDKDYPGWVNMSPDSTEVVYMKDYNLWIMDSVNLHKIMKDDKDSTVVEKKITTDGIRYFSYYYSEYGEDYMKDTTKRYQASVYWSPDSRHFAVMKEDSRGIKDLWVINSLSQPRPTLMKYKYQMPGEPSPKVSLYVFDVGDTSDVTSKCINISAFKDQSIDICRPEVSQKDSYGKTYVRRWLGDDSKFYFTRTSRDLKRIDFCSVSVGSDSATVVIQERMNTYVETRDPKLIKDGSQVIWWSERNGWANLYLYSTDGTLVRDLTDGAFHVEDLLRVDEKAGKVYFEAAGVNKGEDPYHIHLYSVGLDGNGMAQIDKGDFHTSSDCPDDGHYFVTNYSRVDCTPAVALYNAAGGKVMDLETADLSRLFAMGYKFPERFKVKAADGVTDLYGVMYKPFDFDSTLSYPILDYVYPGPQVEANNIFWSSRMTRIDRLAQVGFIVVTVGNRGGHPNRSKWYHNYGYGNLRDYGLEDQKYAVQELAAEHSWIDINRVGIHGHSGGGFMSTAAILTYPDFFKCAVSCSGNHDNSIYNRWWGEQHNGVEEDVSAKGDTTFKFSVKTNEELAGNLKGALMLVTGDIDDNVSPANTIRVVNALIRANKRFEMLVMPGQHHGYGNMNEYFFWRMVDFYSENLLGTSHNKEVDIKELNND